jgi:hypothetical protein
MEVKFHLIVQHISRMVSVSCSGGGNKRFLIEFRAGGATNCTIIVCYEINVRVSFSNTFFSHERMCVRFHFVHFNWFYSF